MERRWLKALTVVAIVAGAAACSDRPSSVTSPVSHPRAATVTSYSVDGFSLLTSTGGGSQTQSVIVDENGGKINIGPNSLEIPSKAVSGPTRFTFTLQSSPYISAKLSAVQVTQVGRNNWKDGAVVTTFARELTLTLSYAQTSTPVPNPSQLKVLWMDNGQVLGVQPTSVDVKGQKLSAGLTHFTDYTPGVPDDPTQPTGPIGLQ